MIIKKKSFIIITLLLLLVVSINETKKTDAITTATITYFNVTGYNTTYVNANWILNVSNGTTRRTFNGSLVMFNKDGLLTKQEVNDMLIRTINEQLRQNQYTELNIQIINSLT
jgi:uncharacterized lipoprotein YmbA